MTKRLRLPTIAVAGLALVAGLSSCQPVPPPSVLTVTQTTGAGAHDADPGDGVCEVTTGEHDCTLTAAIDEANALGRADIDLPAGSYGQIAATVTGHIRVNPTGPARTIGLQGTLTVAAHGSLLIDGARLECCWTTDIDIVVDGLLVIRRSSLYSYSGQVITVRAGGLAVVDNSILTASFSTGVILNEGTAVVRYSVLHGASAPALWTLEEGTSTLTASVLIASSFRVDVAPSCWGTPPVSGGYNVAPDSTCALTGPGDLQDTVATFEPAPGGYNVSEAMPTADSPVVDRVPPGSAGCGIDVTEDFDRLPRPGPGTAGCDSGASELQATAGPTAPTP
jgi:hypothetical protein